MNCIPETDRKLKARIASYRSALNREKKEFGAISDGRGKRYVLFALYFVLNDLKESEAYFRWYEKECPDDVGEPIQKLCWALGLHRMGKDREARRMLADLMLSNLYMIPQILGEKVAEYDIWHFSNMETIDYAMHIPDRVLESFTQDDIDWMKTAYDSPEFQRVRNRYIEIYHELLSVHESKPRGPLLDEADSLLDGLGD